jgi:hypothetical protein
MVIHHVHRGIGLALETADVTLFHDNGKQHVGIISPKGGY